VPRPRVERQHYVAPVAQVGNPEFSNYLERARDAKVLVIDNRNHPSDFPIHTMGGRLVPTATAFARFTRADWANPGAFLWGGGETVLRPEGPMYSGKMFTAKVAVLVDEVTQSSAEFHAVDRPAGGRPWPPVHPSAHRSTRIDCPRVAAP
jgi:hypothetical protein